MLNRDQLQELGRFKLLMRRSCQETVHIEQFLTDRVYQSRLLDMAEDQDDDELLLMLAVTLRGRLGRLGEGEEAFAQICSKQSAAEDSVEPVAVAAQLEPLPVLSVLLEPPAAAEEVVAQRVEDAVIPERTTARTRSVLSSLFGTSANRASNSRHAVIETTPRYIHSLR